MNNIITVAEGDILNMRMVISDKDDTYGHTLIIRHVNTLQSKVDNLENDLKRVSCERDILKAKIENVLSVNDPEDSNCLYDIMCILNE